jgi:hypothetical protein
MPSWKKVITSGSNASLNSLNVTNGVTITGSLNQLGDSNHTGSVYHTGSKFLTGVFSQTGSLNITGSTTQIGTNTLLGNTTLSGSIIISGSTTTPVTPTIKVYGDMETNGVIKFAPVVKNIDTSISASYIYVSGSTNDLYFSQNGLGYNNVTRLRWIEGNLYTGLLNGGLISSQSSTMYQISSGSGIIVNLNASYNENPFPTIEYVNWPNVSASIAPFSASYDQQFVAIQSNGTIYAQGEPYNDGQYNTLIPIGVVLHQNHATINGTQTFASLAYGWKQRSSDFIRAFGPLKISGMTLAVSGSSTGSLVVSSGIAWSDGRNYTVDPNNPSYITDSGTTVSKIFRYYQSGSSWVYDTNAGAGYGAIDPTRYSLNGVLTSVPGGGSNRQWSIQRVYFFPNSVTKAFYVYYGNASYTTELDAIANINIEPFTEAPNTAAQAVYLGAIVVRNNADFTTAASYKIIPGGLFRTVGGSGGGGGSVTQTLAGLSDVSISGPSAGQPLAYDSSTAKWVNTSAISASITGNAATATSASYAATASYVLQAVSASFASTASYVNTLNQTVIITGSAAIGTSSLGPSENTLTLGARDTSNEGGQIGFNAPGGTYTSASFMDNWQNKARILKGNNTTSTGLIAQWDIHTTQMQLPGYTAASSFPGTAAANLAVDSGGNVITVSTSGGTVFPYTGNAVITGSLTATTGFIAPNTNGAMYLRGGDDVELWDINISNHLGVYGQQDSTVASIKLGSGGGVISGKSGNIGIGTINPTANLDVIGTTRITGSLGVTGSFNLQTYNGISDVTALDFGGVTRVINDVMGTSSINADDRDLYDSSAINSVNWEVRRLIDSSAVVTMRWDQRSTYDTVDSQSIDWSSRLLKIDNGPASYTVNWNTGILRDTNAKNSIDWQNRIAIDTANKDSINWQNRQLKDSNGTEILNWTSGVSITGSATVSGSLVVTGSLLITGSSTLINQGPTILSGSFKVQGEGTGFTGPFKAIEVDDANFSRNLYDLNAGSSSIDFGNRSLNSATGQPVISWDGQTGIYNIDLYGSQRISTTNRDSLYGFNSKAGQLLGDSYFDATVSSNELVYLNTDGQWYQVDQTTNTSTKMLGMAIDIFSQTGSVLIEGDIVVSSGGGYPNVNGPNYGLPVYIREGGGTLMSTTIPTTGYVRLLGYCYTSYNGGVDWIMKFRPSNEWIEL